MRTVLLWLLVCAAAWAQNPATAVFPGAVATDQDLLVASNSAKTTLAADLAIGGFSVEVVDASKCTPPMIEKYLSRISGPLIDRIDIHIEVPPVPYRELRGAQDGSDSASMREQVVRARQIQHQRYGEHSTTLNGRAGTRHLRKYCALDAAGEALLKQALTELGLSARAHDKILRVARTIADLAGMESIQSEHVSEAIMYRRLDRQL
jgi:magnesium chelatase family protein